MVVSKTRSGREAAKSLLSAYVTAVEMIRHYVRFGNSAQQKRRTAIFSLGTKSYMPCTWTLHTVICILS